MIKENTVDLSGKFYFLAPNLLDVGSTILPGNFGKNMKARSMDYDPSMLCRELIFESVRLSDNPNAPSRLECVFLFLDLETARNQKHAIGSLGSICYEVSLKDPSAKNLLCDMDYIGSAGQINHNDSRYHATYEIAKKYWSQHSLRDSSALELLTESPVIISATVDE